MRRPEELIAIVMLSVYEPPVEGLIDRAKLANHHLGVFAAVFDDQNFQWLVLHTGKAICVVADVHKQPRRLHQANPPVHC